MAKPKLTPLELRVMEALWTRGACSVREILESLPRKDRPAFTTIQSPSCTALTVESFMRFTAWGGAGATGFQPCPSSTALRTWGV